MNVIISISELSSFGGVARLVVIISEYLESQGHEVTIIAGDYNKEKTFEELRKYKIVNLKTKSKNLVLKQLTNMIKFSMVKLRDYDSILVFDFPATAISLRNQNLVWYCNTPIRLFYDLRGYSLSRIGKFTRPFVRLYIAFMTIFDRFFASRIPVILANSKNIQKRIEKYYGRSSKVVYLGVDIPKGYEPVFEKKLFVISRLHSIKRVDLGVRAMKYLPEYTMHIAGDGPERQNLERIIKEEGLSNVKLLGAVTDDEVDDLYNKCFAVICTPREEDFGLIPLEANAFAKMVIGANEGGLRETIIDGETGLLIDNPSPEKIADAVRRIEKINPKSKIDACLENAKRFNWEGFTRGVEKILGDFEK